MALAELLGNVPTAKFIEEHYLKLPYASPGGCHHLSELGNWETLAALLASSGVDVIVGSQGEQWAGAPPKSGVEARPLVDAGHTIGVRHAQRNDPRLAALATEFEREFCAPVDIHLYCTPAGKPGFGWHYDAEEVFVLQTAGGKEWSLRKNTVNPWPLIETLPANMRYEREIMPMTRCRLAAGDWLYIPNGYWHRTAADEESISLSIGVASLTGVDVFDSLRRRLVDSLRWRQRLPVVGSASPLTPPELTAACQDLFSDLGRDLAMLLSQQSFAEEFIKGRQTERS